MLKREAGFTLVEVTIVIAITASLAVIALAGQGAVRGTAQFTGAVNEAVSLLQGVRNAAQTSDNDAADATGTSNKVVFGKAVSITAGSGVITVTDLTAPVTGDNCSDLGNTLTPGTTSKIVLKWQVKATVSKTVVFHRLACGGELFTYDETGTAVGALTRANFDESPNFAAASPVNISVADPDGRQAVIRIDPAHEGAVTAVYP